MDCQPFVPLVLGVLSAAGGAAKVPASTPAVYEDLAVDLLRRYVQIDTTVPPGNEKKAALFFKDILEGEGIAVEVDEFAPGRANVMATLEGNGKKRPIILMNHMDVVPADASRWSVPPFAGLLRDGVIYGRGVEDMKTEGILQLLALIRLKREGVALARDVIFLGTADEEVGFAGARRAFSAEGWGERLGKAEYAIAEGGENVTRPSGEPAYFAIETAQKSVFWLTLKTTGTPGHGSRPLADSALNRLIRALDRVRQHQTPFKVLPSVARFFRDQATQAAEPRAGWYRDVEKALQDPVAAQALAEDRNLAPLLRNTISITVVRAGYKTNVIPGVAEAELDVRLLPGEDPAAFLVELRGVIADPSVEIQADLDISRAPESPTDTELFRAIERVLGKHYPGVLVTTRMATGATESALVRPLGITAYGFTPLLTTAEEVATGHGDDERIKESTVRRSTGIFYQVVREIAR